METQLCHWLTSRGTEQHHLSRTSIPILEEVRTGKTVHQNNVYSDDTQKHADNSTFEFCLSDSSVGSNANVTCKCAHESQLGWKLKTKCDLAAGPCAVASSTWSAAAWEGAFRHFPQHGLLDITRITNPTNTM
jgi:hypothetical protein